MTTGHRQRVLGRPGTAIIGSCSWRSRRPGHRTRACCRREGPRRTSQIEQAITSGPEGRPYHPHEGAPRPGRGAGFAAKMESRRAHLGRRSPAHTRGPRTDPRSRADGPRDLPRSPTSTAPKPRRGRQTVTPPPRRSLTGPLGSLHQPDRLRWFSRPSGGAAGGRPRPRGRRRSVGGAHPARVHVDAVPLDHLISAAPSAWLGGRALSSVRARLPMLKVLAAEAPLSLQATGAERARSRFAAGDPNRRRHHKPNCSRGRRSSPVRVPAGAESALGAAALGLDEAAAWSAVRPGHGRPPAAGLPR